MNRSRQATVTAATIDTATATNRDTDTDAEHTHTDTCKWVGLARAVLAAGWVYNYLNASTIIRMVGRPNNGPTRAVAAAVAVAGAVAGALAIPSGAICDTQSGGG